MKPVNLTPEAAPVVAAVAAKPSLGVIGGIAASIVALVGVSGYFAMARVESVKSETTAAQQQTTAATTETASIQSQVQSLGQPVVDSDRQLAQGAEQVLVAAYTERHDFVLLAQELRAIMENTGGWYETIEASTSGAGEAGKAVTIVAYMPNKELAASFNERAEATRSLENAETTSLESERRIHLVTKLPCICFKFTLTADLIDTKAPTAGGVGGSTPGGTLVGDGGASDGGLTLSLESEPRRVVKAKPKAPVKPRNPFDIAASAASRGGAS